MSSDMKKNILGLLAFLTFLPSLVCIMAICPMQQAQAQSGEAMPCHEASNDGDYRKIGPDGLMLVQDCMGVGFFYQDANHDFSPDQVLSDIHFVWADITAVHNFAPSFTNDIRGPPRLPDMTLARLPVYFSTQRIRI
tara:strand:- start:7189 stop:7599 length:411 start_codon:yes stop_codon:yes gene_type:complete